MSTRKSGAYEVVNPTAAPRSTRPSQRFPAIGMPTMLGLGGERAPPEAGNSSTTSSVAPDIEIHEPDTNDVNRPGRGGS